MLFSASRGYYNMAALLQRLLAPLSYSFVFQATCPPKFLRKRLKAQVLVQPRYLSRRCRPRFALRRVSFSLEYQTRPRLVDRLTDEFYELGQHSLRARAFQHKLDTYARAMR